MAKLLPYFKFFPSDFEMDDKVRPMDLAHVGLFLKCLNAQWLDGSIPEDLNQLAASIKVPLTSVKKFWPVVAPCFVPADQPGRLVNKRLEQERGNALSKSGKAATSAQQMHSERSAKSMRSHSVRKENASLRVSESESVSESNSPERGAGENENPLYEHFNALMSAWEGHKTEIDLGAQVWISLVDTGDITAETVVDVFAGLERWKTSEQWAKGYVPSVAKWLQGKRWKDSPKQQEGDKW